jgi:hypothetical protein
MLTIFVIKDMMNIACNWLNIVFAGSCICNHQTMHILINYFGKMLYSVLSLHCNIQNLTQTLNEDLMYTKIKEMCDNRIVKQQTRKMIKLKFYLGMKMVLFVNYQFHDCHQTVCCP